MSEGRYFVRLLLPGTETVADEYACGTLSDVARRMLQLAETEYGEGLYDELGELTVTLVGAGERSLTEAERYHLDAIIQEWGGKVPADDDEAAIFREHNTRRKP